MNIDLKAPTGTPQITVKLKARHLIAIERAHGAIGDVEKGLRIIALLMLESDSETALTFDELADMDLTALEPLMEQLNLNK